MTRSSFRRFVVVAAAAIGLSTSAPAMAGPAAAPSAGPSAAAAATAPQWVGSWESAPSGASDLQCADCTIRNVVHTSVGGSELRITISNVFGTAPLPVTHTTVALPTAAGDASADPASVREVQFGGASSVTIPAGQQAVSDPISLTVPANHDLFITTFTPGDPTPFTVHPSAAHVSYYTSGSDQADATSSGAFNHTTGSWYLAAGVQVGGSSATGSVVAFGDSITDGYGGTFGAYTRWSDILSGRLQQLPANDQLGVLNAGIGGNEVLADRGTSYGPSALSRFNRDVLSQPGVKSVIILEGINDILDHPGITSDAIIGGLKQLISAAHAAGVRVIGATLTPFQGYGSYTAPMEQTREQVNNWIRNGSGYDAVVDFDSVLRDPDSQLQMLTVLTYDHLHPNDAGYAALGNSIDPAKLGAYAEPGAVTLSAPTSIARGTTATVTATVMARQASDGVRVSLQAPTGWQVLHSNTVTVGPLAPGQSARVQWQVSVPSGDSTWADYLSATANFAGELASGGATVLAPPPAPTGTVAVSNLAFQSSNGWGPVERDMTNGNTAAFDGTPITLAGKTYTKGLGTNSPSDITVYTGGNCTSFTATVGVDADAGTQGTVTFSVVADGKTLVTTPTLSGGGSTASLNVDIAGARQLDLVVGDAGDGPAFDHGDWADPQLRCAGPANNGVGVKPLLGWSSWSYVRNDPTAAGIEAQARALKNSGLAKEGFDYINIDDFYYTCPGGQGPDVDAYGRWLTDPTKFPSQGGENGIAVVADYVHSLGLKFGIYVTPGISKQAVAQNTPIEGTPYHAADIATGSGENNYNCGGMVGIDYGKAGAQDFVDSWANEFADWGVDYVKIDGVGTGDANDVRAWSEALRQTGRPIHLELSNQLAIGSATTWQQTSNGWRTGNDVECYCSSNGSSFPLTDWNNVALRFDQVAAWSGNGVPGGHNDYDSLELGDGSNDGLTPDERMTQMSLWSLAASPLILGTDLTTMTADDLRLLKNQDVLAVDQDGIDAHRVSSSTTTQIFAKTESDGSVVVGLFNTGSSTQTLTADAAALGLPTAADYLINDLWTHKQQETTGTISATVASHGVALLRLTPKAAQQPVAPNVTYSLSGPANATPGTPSQLTASFTDNGLNPAMNVQFALTAPAGWTVTPTTPTAFTAITSGQSATVTYQVTAPASTQPISTSTLSGTAGYITVVGKQQQTASASITTSNPVAAPYKTFSSAADAPAEYGQSGDDFAISGGGTDMYDGYDDYSTIYQSGAVGTSATIQTEVTGTQNLSGFGKAGIMVRNNITAAYAAPEGVTFFVSPAGGIQLEWDSNGGEFINSVTPNNGTITAITPVYLKLVRSGATYTGYYSTDDSTWNLVGSATVPNQADTQDAGIFVEAHAPGSPALGQFHGFTIG